MGAAGVSLSCALLSCCEFHDAQRHRSWGKGLLCCELRAAVFSWESLLSLSLQLNPHLGAKHDLVYILNVSRGQLRLLASQSPVFLHCSVDRLLLAGRNNGRKGLTQLSFPCFSHKFWGNSSLAITDISCKQAGFLWLRDWQNLLWYCRVVTVFLVNNQI